jgi:hypothetical protein
MILEVLYHVRIVRALCLIYLIMFRISSQIFTIILLLLHTNSQAQFQADNWILGEWVGLNFNTGIPVQWYPVNYSPNGGGFGNGTVMSDSSGNILFYSQGRTIWNRQGNVMQNGDNILAGFKWEQSCVAFPKPESTNEYYLFSVSDWVNPKGLYYSVIDMSLNNGLGSVISKNNFLYASFWAHNKLFVTKGNNSNEYWVVSRLFNDDRYVSFRIDATGVNPDPIYSNTGVYREFVYGDGGYLKISPNKKYLVAAYTRGGSFGPPNPLYAFDICTFDHKTGTINYLFMINDYDTLNSSYNDPIGCEFSPDSKYLYLTFYRDTNNTYLYQFDIEFISDSTGFMNSRVLVSDKSGRGLQLSNDGKIYSSMPSANVTNHQYYLGVVNKPWKKGVDCEFNPAGVYISGRKTDIWVPNILLDYLYRFEWEGDQCQFSPIIFKPNFRPAPDSVRWFFDEFAPGSLSNELSPTYAFQNPGIHEVEVDIWYPTGRFEHTSREIEIYPTPQPDIGPDTVICPGSSVTLNANCAADLYSWNTGQFGTSSIAVSDSGTYWVSASFQETGCQGYDTIHVGFFPETELDTTAVIITPTSCGGATGSITGLYALGPMPLTYQWLDLSGNPFGNNIDATGLPAGQYFLTVTDGNGCEKMSSTYTITDAGNLQVTQVR